MIHPELSRQSVSITLYPLHYAPELWTFEADVFGVWAVHEAHHRDPYEVPWRVTHMPSGCMAFVAFEQQQALEAARRLAAMDEPELVVMESPQLTPISPQWRMTAARALDGVGVYVLRGDAPVPVGELYRKAELEAELEQESGISETEETEEEEIRQREADRRRQEGEAEDQQRRLAYQEAHQDLSIGYGAWPDAEIEGGESEYELALIMRMVWAKDHWPSSETLDALVDAVEPIVKAWLRDYAPAGTRTDLLGVEEE
jgi:hypothetical protein